MSQSNSVIETAKSIYRKLIPSFIRSFFYNKRNPTEASPVTWTLQNKSWTEVLKACEGYDNAKILEKVKSAAITVKQGGALFERDSVLFYEPDYNPELIQAFDLIAANNDGHLHLIDFGGSLGSVYFQYKDKLAKYKSVKWCVVEQPHFVEFGKKELQSNELKFYYNFQECLSENTIKAMLLSSVISYMQDPYKLLAEIARLNLEFIVIDKTLLTGVASDLICKQEVREPIYEASYPCWLLSKEKLIKFMTVNYDLLREFNPYSTKQFIKTAGQEAVFSGLIFKKRSN